MSDRSLLDARLAEIDRRLRAIQSGLAPVAEPPPAFPPESPEPEPASPTAEAVPGPPSAGALTDALVAAHRLAEELGELRTEHAQVIAAARSLLSQLAEQLSRTDDVPASGPRPASGPARPSASLNAGPFTDAASLRRFAESVRDLPSVSGVEVREFVGGDRAVLDVHVAASTSPARRSGD